MLVLPVAVRAPTSVRTSAAAARPISGLVTVRPRSPAQPPIELLSLAVEAAASFVAARRAAAVLAAAMVVAATRAAAGDDALAWPEPGNEGDAEQVW